MPTYQFTINGLRHHDYADCLDQLFLVAPGRQVTLSVEADNPHERNAVIAHLGQCCLGYVRSAQRAEAYALIRAREDGRLQGRIVEADRQHRWLTLEVTTDCPVPPPSSEVERLPLPDDWSFDGPILLEEELDHRLHVMLANLLHAVKHCEPWEEDVEEWLQYVEQELWRDISRETSEQATRLLLLLTGGATRRPEYADKALRLQLAIERMGSPEVRRRQVRHIVEEAHSRRMNLLLCQYGPDAADALLQLPTELTRLFLSDSELLMGRLWYLHLPRRQTRALLTLLSLMVRLHGVPFSDGEDDDDDGNHGLSQMKQIDTGNSIVKGESDNNPCKSVVENKNIDSAAVRIAKGCKTKLLVILNAVYHAGWLRDNQDRPLTNRDKALNDILRLAFGEEKPVAVRNLIWPSRNADNPERHQKTIKELLDSLPDEME